MRQDSLLISARQKLDTPDRLLDDSADIYLTFLYVLRYTIAMAQGYDNLGKSLWADHAVDLSRFVLGEELMQESKTYQRQRERIIRENTIENTLALLSDQFQPETVSALTPALRSVNDLQKLKQLHLAAARVQNIEAFAQMLHE